VRSLPTWHIRLRPSIRGVLVGAGVWLLCVSALHVFANHRGALVTRAEARPVQVGGLPVT
jgi:hypothetical protein